MPDVIAEPVIVVDVDMKQGLKKAQKQAQSTFTKMGSMLSNFYVRVGKGGPRAGWSGINPMKMMGGGDSGGGGGMGSAGLSKMAVGLGLTALLGVGLMVVKKLSTIIKNTEVFKYLRTLIANMFGAFYSPILMIAIALNKWPKFFEDQIEAWAGWTITMVSKVIEGVSLAFDFAIAPFEAAIALAGGLFKADIELLIATFETAWALTMGSLETIWALTFGLLTGGWDDSFGKLDEIWGDTFSTIGTTWEDTFGKLGGIWDDTFGKLVRIWDKTFGKIYGKASSGGNTPEGTYAGIAGVATVGAGISQNIVSLLAWTKGILEGGTGAISGLSAVEQAMLRRGIAAGVQMGQWSADEVERATGMDL